MTNEEAFKKAIENIEDPWDRIAIEENNGWTRIEPDGSNLPEANKNFYLMFNGAIFTGNWYVSNLRMKKYWHLTELNISRNIEDITHYREIEEIPKPIY